MDTRKTGRACVLFLLVSIALGYEVPEVQIKLLQPKGFEASIPDTPEKTGKITLFVFQGHLNRSIAKDQVGTLSGEVLNPESGRWVYKNHDVTLTENDYIEYYVVVVFDKNTYVRDNQKFVVAASSTPTTKSDTNCKLSVTRVRGLSSTCSGEVLFQDTFNSLDNRVWQVQQYIPVHDYGYPFVSYQTSAVAVNNGQLEITPSLQRDHLGYNTDKVNTGKLDLYDGCTGPEDSCYHEASGADILPPVVGGRVTSKEFAFTYGVVEVRARMPIGDWLFSEIHLEAADKQGGFEKITKIIKIASTRGNEMLSDGRNNKVLYGGVIVSPKCREVLLTSYNHTNNWGENYHIYSVEWRPERIILRVDGQEWGTVEGNIREKFGPRCEVPMGMLSGNSSLSPFDTHYYLSLGVAAGGIAEFNDNILSGTNRKPWKNLEAKAKLKFWRHQNKWHPTWKQPGMMVDFVKVTAL